MQQQLSEQTFQSRQAFIKQNLLAYVDIKQTSPVIIIGLHQHYGLQNYMRLMLQYITNNQHSIIIPSLFNQQTSTDQHQNDDLAFLSSLDHSRIAEIVYKVCEYAAKSGKKIVLIGFSIGAAIGLKMLECIECVDLAFMFYGMPPLQGVRPELIRAQTKIVVGSRDKMKYLSDGSMVKQAKKLYEKNGKIELIEVEGVGHGFMNPACGEYSQQHFDQYSTMLQQKIGSLVSKSNNYNQKRAAQNKIGQDKQTSNLQPQDQSLNQQDREKQNKQQKKQDSCMLI